MINQTLIYMREMGIVLKGVCMSIACKRLYLMNKEIRYINYINGP